MKLRRTYNDDHGPRSAATTYEILDDDGVAIGHVCRYDKTHAQLRKYSGVTRPLATGRTVTYSHWRARLFGRAEGPQRNTRRAALEAVLDG